MDKDKIIDKIKKCMALGQSSNANEAAAALRQAQKMMAAHGLTEDDVEGSSYGDEAVEVPIQVNKKPPIHLVAFVALMMKAFQVRAAFESNIRVSDASYRIRYFGPAHRTAMAGYAHVVIFRGMENAWKKQLSDYPHWKGIRGARLSFMTGWLEEIASKVEGIGWPEGEEERSDRYMAKFYGKELTVSENRKYSAYRAVKEKGRAAAADFEINRPMNQQHRAIGKD